MEGGYEGYLALFSPASPTAEPHGLIGTMPRINPLLPPTCATCIQRTTPSKFPMHVPLAAE